MTNVSAHPAVMTGAEALVRSLLASGVDTCFTNPGTSEMHFVAALDKVEGMRCVLALFEGVATGAADGYARMSGRPASTLLHLGPGLANGMANLHNAHRAHSPVVNIVGEHGTAHRQFSPPLQANIEAMARVYAQWVKTVESPDQTGTAAAAAVAAALTPPGQISTLVLPADCAWRECERVGTPQPVAARSTVDETRVRAAADLLRKGQAALIVNGPMLRTAALEICGRIAAATGAELLMPTQVARVERGAGRVAADRIPYVVDAALKRLQHLRHVVLINARAPVAFFAYPDKPSLMLPPDCEVLTLADDAEDGVDAAARLADALGASQLAPRKEALNRPPLPSGPITPSGFATVVASLLPEQTIVVDESVVSGRALIPATRGAAPHDWLVNPGGSIGMGLPVAVGAAIACPDRKVLCLSGDGSAMYTVQALWTMAREQLNVVTVIFSNRTYEILKGEFRNVGAGEPGRKALDMLEIGRPALDWLALAKGQGVPATRADNLERLARQLAGTLSEPGPQLIEVMI